MGSKNPRLNFTYSYIYDQTFAVLTGNKYFEGTSKEAASYMKALEKEFSRFSGKVLAGIPRVSGLRWQKPYIDVYISKYAPSSFSVPLTVRMYKNAKVGNSILVHELVHNIVFQNQKHIRYVKLFKDFRTEEVMTKYHIIEGAILYLLNRDIFSDGLSGFFEYDNWASPKAGEAYRHAISIVLERSAEKIIKSYISKG